MRDRSLLGPLERHRTMNPEEFADLEREAGYPFLSEQHAQEFRLRKVQMQAIDRMLACPYVDRRRVGRDN